ncbi:hypothetical protein NDN08_001075 [Rhodosorus marinus]|uniref:SCD domain-containing protein n=1 Tax=Rhodosorus marinus TaxID=101924 RepID=A0AAV8UTV5_9RHOD|nr:hypothetical protein NDN08_001075 [Rhodosorus marinus]
MSVAPGDDGGLYYVLRDHASSIGSTLRGFILKCKDGAPLQMYHLLELVTRSSYSNTIQESLFQLDMKKVDDLQADCVANDFTEFMGKSDVGSNILVFGSDAESRKFQAAYEEFWRRFITNYPPDDLIKSELFENLLEFLISLSESGSRSLRFISCLTVYCMMDGLLEFHRSLKHDLNALEQKIGEETSTRRRRSSEKLGSIEGTLESAASAADKVAATSDRTFAEVFVHRSRDCFPDIRALSITALSRWIEAAPESFMDEDYIKHIGWLLFDKDSTVRCSALRALDRILQALGPVANVEMLLRRFRVRLREACRDPNDTVAVLAIKLSALIFDYGLHEQRDVKLFFDLSMRDTSPKIREAATSVVSDEVQRRLSPSVRLYETIRGNDNPSISTTKLVKQIRSDTKPRRSTRTVPDHDLAVKEIVELVKMLHKLKPIRSTTSTLRTIMPFAKSIGEQLPALRITEAFVELLTDSPDSPLNSSETQYLLMILIAVVCQSAASKEKVNNVAFNLAVLAAQLPLLLEKFQGDEHLLTLVVLLSQHVGAGVFRSSLLEREFNLTLRFLAEYWKRASSSSNLRFSEAVYSTWASLADSEHGFVSECRSKLKTLVSESEADLNRAYSTGLGEKDEFSWRLVNFGVLARFVAPVGELGGLLVDLLDDRLKEAELLEEGNVAIPAIELNFLNWAWKSDIQKARDASSSEILSRLSRLATDDSVFRVRAASVQSACDILAAQCRRESRPGTLPPNADVAAQAEEHALSETVGALFGDLVGLSEAVEPKGFEDWRIRCLASICQACLLGGLPERVAHLPLTMLAKKGSRDQELFFLAREYHQRLRDRDQSVAWEFELGALIFLGGKDIESANMVASLSRSLAMRYPFWKDTSAVASLTCALLRYNMNTAPDRKMLKFLSAALPPLVQKLHYERASTVKSALQLRLSQVPVGPLRNAADWKRLLGIEEVLNKMMARDMDAQRETDVDINSLPLFYGFGQLSLIPDDNAGHSTGSEASKQVVQEQRSDDEEGSIGRKRSEIELSTDGSDVDSKMASSTAENEPKPRTTSPAKRRRW